MLSLSALALLLAKKLTNPKSPQSKNKKLKKLHLLAKRKKKKRKKKPRSNFFQTRNKKDAIEHPFFLLKNCLIPGYYAREARISPTLSLISSRFEDFVT